MSIAHTTSIPFRVMREANRGQVADDAGKFSAPNLLA
jgi:hypothetical protein